MKRIQTESLSDIQTLEEWNHVWVNEILVGVVKENTRAMYKDTMERHILPFLGTTPLEELSPGKVGEWVIWLQNNDVPGTMKGKMTEGTVRNILSVLSGCLRDAQKYGLIEENPRLEASWKMSKKNLWENQEWLSEEQIKEMESPLFQYRNKKDYPEGLFYQLMLYAGLTVSETAALRWKDVDLERRVLHIQYYAEGDVCRKTTGKRHRKIPMPEVLAKQLRKVRERYQPEEESFVTTGEREISHVDQLRVLLRRRSDRIGVGRVTPRMLRDTYAIRAVQTGATSDMIADLIGVASSQQVVRRYMPKNRMDEQSLVNRMYPEK